MKGGKCISHQITQVSAVSDVELPMCAESNANELKQRFRSSQLGSAT